MNCSISAELWHRPYVDDQGSHVEPAESSQNEAGSKQRTASACGGASARRIYSTCGTLTRTANLFDANQGILSLRTYHEALEPLAFQYLAACRAAFLTSGRNALQPATSSCGGLTCRQRASLRFPANLSTLVESNRPPPRRSSSHTARHRPPRAYDDAVC
jgi:hypothetical protein